MTTGRDCSTQNQLRHRCRNPRCGVKLKAPIENARDAFCYPGCYESFYRSRCLVCERPFDRKTERKRVCNRSKCRHEFRRHPERFQPTRYRASVLDHNASGNARFTGLKTGQKSGRAWRKVAGPDLTEINFRIPLDPELVARLKKVHAASEAAWRKAAWHAKRRALIKHHTPPINVIGGYRFPDAPVIDLSPIEAPQWAITSRWVPTGDGTDVPPIPDFLIRAAPRPAATEETDPPPGTGLDRKKVA
jgi:hypothetical protein